MNEDERPEVDSELPTIPRPAGSHEVGLPEATGRTVAGFRVLQKLGEGGMGVVYEAEQEKPVRRRVALKLIKPGMDTSQVVARFESERQALALMSHPSIAAIYDGGATEDGRPYFAMELVHGERLTQYCDKNRLTIKERLELFIRVCEGVQHAHQKGIIHRDLKPSNILVTIRDEKPVPKIIDFGVAKATSQRLTDKTLYTQLGQWMGTPVYMSPEQAGMTGIDVDTRSDVYSLGVVLYELLAGALPFDPTELKKAGFEGFARVLRETQPKRPSTRVHTLAKTHTNPAQARRLAMPSLEKALRGDLDWITMKALEKDRNRRYASPSDLAEDIRRHLRHEPVVASPPSVVYRARKFVRRHKVGVGAAALVVLALVLGITAASVGLVRAQRAEAEARQEAETAQQVSDFLVELFGVSDPYLSQGNTVTAREILDRGTERIREELTDQPLVQARLMAIMGAVHTNLGLLEEAESFYRSALATREAALGERDLTVAKNLLNLSFVEIGRGRYEEAVDLGRRALRVRTDVLGENDPLVAEVLAGMAQALYGMGRLDESERLYLQALDIYERRLPEDHPDVVDAINDLAVVYAVRGDYQRAEELFLRALKLGERTEGPDHPKVGLRLTSLGFVSRELGRLEEAEDYLERSLEILEKVFGEQHPQVANTLCELGLVYAAQGRYAEAEPLYERSLAIRVSRLGESHPHVTEALLGLAEVRRNQDRPREAEAYYRRSLSILEGSVDPGHILLVRTRKSYAAFLRAQGRGKEAAAMEARLRKATGSDEGGAS